MFWVLIGDSVKYFFVPVSNGIVGSITSSFIFWLFILIGIIFSITLHSFFHAYAALKLGDPSPRDEGRLSLNPFRHFDLLGFTFLLLTIFGYEKPMTVNPYNFKDPARGDFIFAMAGPAANVLLANVCGVLFFILSKFPPSEGFFTTLTYAIGMLGMYNLNYAVFHLLPIPPLDGVKVWGYVHYKISDFIQQYIAPYSLIILIFLIVPIFGNASLLQMLLLPFDTIYFTLIGF